MYGKEIQSNLPGEVMILRGNSYCCCWRRRVRTLEEMEEMEEKWRRDPAMDFMAGWDVQIVEGKLEKMGKKKKSRSNRDH